MLRYFRGVRITNDSFVIAFVAFDFRLSVQQGYCCCVLIMND